MTDAARATLRKILAATGMTQRQLAALFGRDENTVHHHLSGRVIPRVTSDWLNQIQEVRTQPGRAEIVVGMPADTPVGVFKRFDGPK